MRTRGLGYIGITGTDLDAWRALLVEVLGLGEGDGPLGDGSGSLWLRLDGRTWRVCVTPGDTDAFAFAGWELGDGDEFAEAVATLRAAGTDVAEGTDELRAARGVADVARFSDPFGVTHEIFYGQTVEEPVFVPPHGGNGFLTEGVGMGHALFVVPSNAEALAFFGAVMGFKVTDRFAWGPNGAVFMRSTPRHHSLAFLDLPLPSGPGLNHFMVEANSFEDVGLAYDRAMDARVPIVNSLGQHSNDPMISFYVQSPAGFNVELGWNGLMVDDDTWTVNTWTGRGEIWGHRGDFMDAVGDAKV